MVLNCNCSTHIFVQSTVKCDFNLAHINLLMEFYEKHQLMYTEQVNWKNPPVNFT